MFTNILLAKWLTWDWEDENMHILSREGFKNKDEGGGKVVHFLQEEQPWR